MEYIKIGIKQKFGLFFYFCKITQTNAAREINKKNRDNEIQESKCAEESLMGVKTSTRAHEVLNAHNSSLLVRYSNV